MIDFIHLEDATALDILKYIPVLLAVIKTFMVLGEWYVAEPIRQ